MDARSSRRFNAVDDLCKTKQPQKHRSVWSSLYALLAVLLLAFSLVFFFSAGFGTRNVVPQDKLADYNAAEALGLIVYIGQSETLDQCAQTAQKYHILNDEELAAMKNSQNLAAFKKQLVDIVKSNVPGGPKANTIIEPRKS